MKTSREMALIRAQLTEIKLVELAQSGGVSAFVNPRDVAWLEAAKGGDTLVHLRFGDVVPVLGTPDTIRGQLI